VIDKSTHGVLHQLSTSMFRGRLSEHNQNLHHRVPVHAHTRCHLAWGTWGCGDGDTYVVGPEWLVQTYPGVDDGVVVR
jgi:hypothetical protein